MSLDPAIRESKPELNFLKKIDGIINRTFLAQFNVVDDIMKITLLARLKIVDDRMNRALLARLKM